METILKFTNIFFMRLQVLMWTSMNEYVVLRSQVEITDVSERLTASNIRSTKT